MNRQTCFQIVGLALGGLLVSAAATAAPILVQHSFDTDWLHPNQTNDCSGYFGRGFDNCNIFVFEGDEKKYLSPVIAKYGENGELVEVREDLEPFEADQISVGFDDTNSGSWTYNPDAGSPAIRFWAAKGGNGFNLFWYLNQDTYDNNDCANNAYSFQCMDTALEVDSGTWWVPDDKGLSHITFYNGSVTTKVPEPGTAALLLTGALGLFAARRRQNRLSAA